MLRPAPFFALTALLLSACVADEPTPEPFTTVAASVEIIAAPEDDGSVRGLNLDDHVSDGASMTGCFKPDDEGPDGSQGIDNQLARLGNIVTQLIGYQGDFSDLVQEAINDGRFILMVRIEDAQDLMNDDDVTVRVIWGDGPTDIGNDGRLVPGQSFDIHPERAEARLEHLRIVDGHIEGDGFEVVLPVNILQLRYDLPVRRARFSLDVNPEDGTLTGLVGGSVALEDVVEIAVRTGEDISGVQTLIRRLADMPSEEGNCDHMSVAMAVSGVPAFLLPPIEVTNAP